MMHVHGCTASGEVPPLRTGARCALAALLEACRVPAPTRTLRAAREQVTEWDSTSIAFTPSDDGDIQVRGFGVSLWRDVHVCFELRGLLTTLTRERWHGVVEKQHIGQYTNSNTYSIQVDLERGEIQGDYAQGVLRLERRHGAFPPPPCCAEAVAA